MNGRRRGDTATHAKVAPRQPSSGVARRVLPEVVDVVAVDVAELADVRRDVARDRDVDEEERAGAAAEDAPDVGGADDLVLFHVEQDLRAVPVSSIALWAASS